MMLNAKQVENAKPKEKLYRLFDGGGLYLEVTPAGGKYWRFKYRFDGKEKRMALGVYPDISLSDARERREQARKLVANNVDPSTVKKEQKLQIKLNAENDFESVAREWHKSRINGWSENYAGKVMTSMEQDVFPQLGKRPIKDISPAELLSVLRLIEKRGAIETMHRVKQNCGQVFLYAIACSKADRNPAADLRMALPVPKKGHYAHLKADELSEYLDKLEAYDGSLQTKLALKLLLLTFVRTIELRGAQWSEINFDKAEWRIPKERMKMKEQHIVPLSTQVIKLIRELQLHTGNRQYLFPNQHKPMTFMSENTMLFAIYRMGYHSRTTGHGFRATASTILNEHGFPPDHIESQLAHAERSKSRAAYNHAQYLPKRREMMQWWADYLENLKTENCNVIGRAFRKTQ